LRLCFLKQFPQTKIQLPKHEHNNRKIQNKKVAMIFIATFY